MANSVDAINYFAQKGVNAVEVDIYKMNGVLKFHHPDPSDCSCLTKGVCDYDGQGESNGSTINSVINAIINKKQIQLIYLDTKIETNPSSESVANEIIIYAWENGYTGQFLLGVPAIGHIGFLSEVKELVEKNYKDRADIDLFYTYDGGKKSTMSSDINKLKNIVSNTNIVYSAGVSACSPASYADEVKSAKTYYDQNKIAGNFTWTLDKQSSIDKSYGLGFTGILSNYGERVSNYVKHTSRLIPTQN